MKDLLTKNIGLKLLAFLIAFILWLVVVDYDDPIMSTTFSGVVVDIQNVDSLTDIGKVYEVKNGSNIISVTVTGKRSVVESISKANIVATADLTKMSIMDTVEIQLSTNKNFSQLDSIKSDSNSVELSIENLSTINLPATVVVDGTPAEGYMLGDVTTNQNTVRISGPESLVSKITQAVCNVSVEGRLTDIVTTADIELLDENGIRVEGNNLTTNIKSLNVTANILAVKAVDIVYSYSGVPADGYVVSGDISGDKNAVYIAGKNTVIEGMSFLTVPASAINVDGKDESYTTVVDLTKCLPDGVIFADENFDGKVVVSVNIEKTIKKMFNVPVENITFYGTRNEEAMLCDAAGEELTTFTVALTGLSDSFTGITAADIKGYINIDDYMNMADINEIRDGIYSMDVSFSLPAGLTLEHDVQLSVQISEEE